MGKVLYVYVCRRCYDFNVFVSSILVSMYRKCGSIEDV